MSDEQKTLLPLRDRLAARLHELQCDRMKCDEQCKDDYEHEAADEIIAMVSTEQPKHAPEVHALSSETGRGMDAALYGSIALAKKHPEAFRDLEEFMANNGIRTLAIGSMRVERGPDTFDRGEACFHGKVFIESNLSMGPCPKCEKNAEQANGRIEITDEMVEKAAAAIMRRYVDCGAFADDDSSVTATDRDAARRGLEAALNG